MLIYTRGEGHACPAQACPDYFLNEKRQVIRLGVSTIPAGYVLPTLISQIRRDMPFVVIKGIESNSRGIIEKVRENLIDVGIVGMKGNCDDCEFIPIYKDEIVFIAPNTPYYTDLQQQQATLLELIKEPLIIRESGSGIKKNMDMIIQEAGADVDKLNVVSSINDIEVVKKLVMAGVGTSFVSLISVIDQIRKKELITIPLEGAEHRYRYLYLTWNRNLTQPAHIREFTQHVIKIAKQDFC